MGIKFQCPKCNKELEAENDHAGMQLECPECKEKVTVPTPSLKVADPPEENTSPAPKKDEKLTAQQWVGGCLTLIVAAVVIGGCIKGCFMKGSPEKDAESQNELKQKEEIAKLSPEDKLKYLIKKKLGKLNRKGDKIRKFSVANDLIEVDFSIDDNLTKNWVKTGMNGNVLDILQTIRDSKFHKYSTVRTNGYLALQDKYGRKTEQKVLSIEFARQDIEKIDFANFPRENIYYVGRNIWLHPTMR